MKTLEEVIALVPELTRVDLERWIGAALVETEADRTDPVLSDIEVARVRLICSLRYDMEVEEDTLPVVLGLIDQLHDTRERLYALCGAVAAQDKEIRQAVLELLEKAGQPQRS